MSVLIRVQGTKAIFRTGAWVSCDPALERDLNLATAVWIEETGGPSLKDRDPERSCAEAVALRVGGVLLRHIPSAGAREVFLARRQMTLAF
jgi:hypothetical protein